MKQQRLESTYFMKVMLSRERRVSTAARISAWRASEWFLLSDSLLETHKHKNSTERVFHGSNEIPDNKYFKSLLNCGSQHHIKDDSPRLISQCYNIEYNQKVCWHKNNNIIGLMLPVKSSCNIRFFFKFHSVSHYGKHLLARPILELQYHHVCQVTG